MSAPRRPTLLDLPDDLLFHILSKLPGVSLARISQVCTRLHALSSYPLLWRAACLSAPGFPPPPPPAPRASARYWRTCFRQFYCRTRAKRCPGCLRAYHAPAPDDATTMPLCAFFAHANKAAQFDQAPR